jgi:hypothetical protein
VSDDTSGVRVHPAISNINPVQNLIMTYRTRFFFNTMFFMHCHRNTEIMVLRSRPELSSGRLLCSVRADRGALH